MEIAELKSVEGWREAFPVMNQLREALTEESYISYLMKMSKEGYRLFALKKSNEIVSLAGFSIVTNFYYGRHIWIYDLVTLREFRSHGYGQKLMEFVEGFAHEHSCEVIALSSGLERSDAHRFYEGHLKYEKPSYVFKKAL